MLLCKLQPFCCHQLPFFEKYTLKRSKKRLISFDLNETSQVYENVYMFTRDFLLKIFLERLNFGKGVNGQNMFKDLDISFTTQKQINLVFFFTIPRHRELLQRKGKKQNYKKNNF